MMTNGEEQIFQKLHALGVAGQRPEKLFLMKKETELKESLERVYSLLTEAWLTLYPEYKANEENSWNE